MVKTRADNIQIQAESANKGWAWWAMKYLELLVLPETMRRLKLTAENRDIEQQRELGDQFFFLLLKGASVTAWQGAKDSHLPPWMWFGIHDQDKVEAEMCHDRIRRHVKDGDLARKLLREPAFNGQKDTTGPCLVTPLRFALRLPSS